MWFSNLKQLKGLLLVSIIVGNSKICSALHCLVNIHEQKFSYTHRRLLSPMMVSLGGLIPNDNKIKRLKVLCLHGYLSSAKLFQVQTQLIADQVADETDFGKSINQFIHLQKYLEYFIGLSYHYHYIIFEVYLDGPHRFEMLKRGPTVLASETINNPITKSSGKVGH